MPTNASRIWSDIARASWDGVDPGDGNEIQVRRHEMSVPLRVGLTDETRTIMAPQRSCQTLVIAAESSGGRVDVTFPAKISGNDLTLRLQDNEVAVFISARQAVGYRWKLASTAGGATV